MKHSIKKGDTIKCVDDGGHTHLTNGKTYTALATNGSESEVQLLDNSGVTRWYFTNRFEPLVDAKSMDLFQSIEYAQTFIGKPFTYSGAKTVASHVKVYLSDKEFASYGSVNAQNEVKARGFSVCLHGENGNEYPVAQVELAPESYTMELTDDYDAVIYVDRVEVGCQTIPKAVLEELLDRMEKLAN